MPSTARAALLGHAGPVPTTAFMAPSALSRLLDAGKNRRQRFDSLRLLAHAGSPCPPIVKRRALERVGPDVLWEFYGSTEGQFTVCSPDEWLARPGTVGRARAGRTLSVDPDGTVWCRPPGFGRFTYWRDPAKTAAAWRDGFFTVGDLGRIDADGYLYLDGRRDDLIISGGVNVYPAEVESVLSEVDGVGEIAVFGVSDDRWGQRVCAAVVPAATPGPQSAAPLIERLARLCLGPTGRLQAPQAVRDRRRPAPHRHRQGATQPHCRDGRGHVRSARCRTTDPPLRPGEGY